MRRWLRDRPWIWIVLLLALLMAAGIGTVVIAEFHRPEIVKPRG
jgi:ABC-type multidrug transport system permease subunit